MAKRIGKIYDHLSSFPKDKPISGELSIANVSAGPMLDLPVVDLSALINKDKDTQTYKLECQKVADAFHKYGICVIKDPRVDKAQNNEFLSMMERYFESSDGKRDARPAVHYQVGVTPSFIEQPRNHCKNGAFGAYGPDDKPLTLCPPERDPKWRFFWRIGERPKTTNFAQLHAEPVIPPNIPEWEKVMNSWGNQMLNAMRGILKMAAVGFELEEDAFVEKTKFGPHLLAPTGSNFNKFGKLGTVLAGFHYDFNLLTVHGKSRFPGLNIWTRNKKKVGVKVPDGCLLVQAGKQLEYLTGGHVLAGFHEVVVMQSTLATIKKKKAAGESLWRVSSTFFGHAGSDQDLEPLGRFKTSSSTEKYPPIKAGKQVWNEVQETINPDNGD